MAIKMANMCARVTSTYMEFTLTFGLKLEFKFSFKLDIKITNIYIDLRTNVCYYIYEDFPHGAIN